MALIGSVLDEKMSFSNSYEAAFTEMEQEWKRGPLKWQVGKQKARRRDFRAMMAQQRRLFKLGYWNTVRTDIFGVIRAGRKEDFHNNMLAWLFDPFAPHGLSERFLRRFVSACCDSLSVDTEFLLKADVSREESAAESREDIVVRCPGLTLVIETKVDAAEQPRQCDRIFADHKDDPHVRFVFLTPTGRAPEKASERVKAEFVCIGFLQVRKLLRETVNRTPASTRGRFELGLESVRNYLRTLDEEFR